MLGDQQKQTRQPLRIGNDVHVILQPRDVLLLKTLSSLRIIDREQASVICGFKSLTRVNARLLKLRLAGLLKRFFFVSPEGGKRAIYSLTRHSANIIGTELNGLKRPADSFLLGDRFAAHQLALNQVYCACFFRPLPNGVTVKSWRIFQKPLSSSCFVIPDGYFEIHSTESIRPVFLEVDLGTEGLTVWNKKIKQYINFAASGEFSRLFEKQRFSVLVVTGSERRLHSLRSAIQKITPKLFYLTSSARIKEQGLGHAIWFRPEGEQTHSLT